MASMKKLYDKYISNPSKLKEDYPKLFYEYIDNLCSYEEKHGIVEKPRAFYEFWLIDNLDLIGE